MQKIQKTMFLVAAFSMWISTGVQAADITVPHTFSSGTTIKSSEFNENFSTIYQKYNELAAEVADLKAGSCSTAPDLYGFCDNGNGTVTHAKTGLILLANANCFGVLDWSSAMSAVYTLADGQCGLTDGSAAGDWRLPNSTQVNGSPSRLDGGELEVIYNAKDDPVFSNVQVSGYSYWSGTSLASSMSSAWGVFFYGGGGFQHHLKTTASFYVWPVRGGQ